MGDVPELRNRIVSPGDLSEQEQHELVQSLRQLSDGGEDIAIDLIKLMRGRHNLYESVANDLDELLDAAHGEASYGSAGRTLIRAMTTQLDRAVLTPVLGTGLTDSLVGGRRALARAFAEEFEYPMSLNERDDLPQVAQFVHVKAGDLTLRDSLNRHLEKQLRGLLGDRTRGTRPTSTSCSKRRGSGAHPVPRTPTRCWPRCRARSMSPRTRRNCWNTHCASWASRR